MRELEDGVAYFGLNAVARNTRSSYDTGGKQYCRFVVWADVHPGFPASDHTMELWSTFLARTVKYSTTKAYLAALRDLHLELGYPMPGFEDLKRLRRTLRGIKRLKGNPKCKKLGIGPKELTRIFFQGKIDLTKDNDRTCWTGCLLAFGVCFRKANITAKKQACFAQSGVMLRGGVKFIGKDQMEVAAGFSKTNQFAEREHNVLFNAVRYPALSAVTLTRRALALDKLPGGPKAPVLSYRKSDGQQVALTHSVFDHWLKDKLMAAGLQPELYSGHSFRRGAATLAFAERMPRNLVKHWGDWVSDAVNEYHEMTQELVADSMEAAVGACC
ncbi:hypothetical protein CYMTET_36818 [Cymbomonas tetramitiformis]|uniref:Uncharacterized protein n=1 Tax=Cymbomonas tetramitiformis TaxID=36881 RepID=A0AAE0F794_9CHLO|nr:hypothetical protein CYMTET_36818 [Cymbomonas tetramitiformis]